MTIDWTKPLVVAGTDRVATVQNITDFRVLVWSGDWGNGQSGNYSFDAETGKGLVAFDLAVTNAPPTPKLGPACKMCDGQGYKDYEGFCMDPCDCDAPPTPRIGPEHIEALVEAIVEARLAAASAQVSIGYYERNPCSVRLAYHKALKPAAEQRAARLAEIRAYLESM